MRSPNWFWSSDRFITFAAWKDRAGPLALWPSLMVETQVDLGVDVQSTRWTLVLGRHRWQLDVARCIPRAAAGKVDWSAGPGGMEEMLRWAKKVFRRSWTKADLEKLFAKKPEWRRLVVQSGSRHHYIRVLLARELMDQESDAGQAGPLPRASVAAAEQLAAALRMPKVDEKFESEWSNASLDARRRPFRSLGTVENQDPMEQLDHLASLLDLPQEVRNLDQKSLDAISVVKATPAPIEPAATMPAQADTGVKAESLPSYLPQPSNTADISEQARLLEARLSEGENRSSNSHPSLTSEAPTGDRPMPSESPSNDRPAFLPPPGPQDDTSRALAEALQRALEEPEPSDGRTPGASPKDER